MIHSLVFVIVTWIVWTICALVAWLVSPFSENSIRPVQAAARLWAKIVIIFSGVKLKTSGLENIPRDRAVVFASNHQGALDIILLQASLPNFRFTVHRPLFSIPFFGFMMRKAGYIPIDRYSILGAYHTGKEVLECLAAGEAVLIFPEGIRSRTGELNEFKHGSLAVALESGAPVIPIAISGSFNFLPRKTWVIRPCPIKLSVGEPIYIKSKEEYDQKLKEVRETIARML